MNDKLPFPDGAASDSAMPVDVVIEKLTDAETPGYQAEFDPAEAERAGAFVEDALTESDAFDSVGDQAIVSSSRASR